MVTTPLTTISLLMRTFMANFVRIHGICKEVTENRLNEPRVRSFKMETAYENKCIF